MALIICPKCGKEISDKSIYCVHCGAPIFVCPECGKITTSEERVCKHCGYMANTPAPVVSQNQLMESETPIEFWKRKNPKWGMRDKNIEFVEILFFVLAIGLGVISYFFVLKPWLNIEDQDPIKALEMMLDYEQSIKYVWIIATSMLVCILVSFLVMATSSNKNTRCAKWLLANKVNIKAAFQRDIPKLFPNGVDDNNFSITDLHKVYYESFTTHRKMIIFRLLIGGIGLFGSISWYLIQHSIELCNYIREVVGKGISKYEASSLSNISDIFIVLLFVLVIAAFCIEAILSNKRIKYYLQTKAKELRASKKVG